MPVGVHDTQNESRQKLGILKDVALIFACVLGWEQGEEENLDSVAGERCWLSRMSAPPAGAAGECNRERRGSRWCILEGFRENHSTAFSFRSVNSHAVPPESLKGILFHAVTNCFSPCCFLKASLRNNFVLVVFFSCCSEQTLPRTTGPSGWTLTWN